MEIEVWDEPVRWALVVRRVVRMDELSSFFREAFGRAVEAAHSGHMEIAGPPFAWYHGVPTTSIDVAAGIPVEHVTGELPPGISAVERPGGRSVVAIHVGPFEALRDTYQAVEQWMAEQGLAAGDDGAWEEYLTDPVTEPDQSTWQTRIVLPLATAP